MLKRVNDDMKNVEDIRTRANNYLKLDTPYEGETNVLHYLEVLRDRVGFDEIKKKVVNPLKGKEDRRLLRLPSAATWEKSWHLTTRKTPAIMEDFIRALGAEPVVYRIPQ